MSEINDGGAAFPSTTHGAEGHLVNGPEFGMSLRDYFAAVALQRLYMDHGGPDHEEEAETAYKMADAMLIARNSTTKE